MPNIIGAATTLAVMSDTAGEARTLLRPLLMERFLTVISATISFGGGPTVDHLIAQAAGSPKLNPKGSPGRPTRIQLANGYWVYGRRSILTHSTNATPSNNSFVLPGNTALAGGGGVCGTTGAETCIGNYSTTIRTEWLLTLRPRVGYAWGNTLVFGTGGLALTRLKFSQTYNDNITIPFCAAFDRRGWFVTPRRRRPKSALRWAVALSRPSPTIGR